LEKRISKHPEKFGKGAVEGVAGPETANNSYCGGAMIPLFTLGIPSSPTIAILLGAFIMHGLTPGPVLFSQNPTFVWGIIASMFIGNAMLLIMNLPMANWWAKIAQIPAKLLYPTVLIISVLGAYTVSNDLWDVGVMVIFGVLGYIMKKIDIPMAPIVLTYVLSSMMEKALLQSIKMNGSMIGLVKSPISLVMLILAVIVFVASLWAELKNKKSAMLTSSDE
jgi:putative tricarboxylic transport membrane protein